jgi:GrpB-like predicted nucleotidyltransferase (UPF0157 family)
MPEVEIVPYQPSWPQEFGLIGARLRRALGPLAQRIDHIGSTSIPQMAAKDVIDIQVTTSAFDDRLKSALTSMGYIHLEARVDHRPPNSSDPEDHWVKWLFLPPADERRVHVHVRIQGAPNQRYALLFRDYLRAHEASAQAYAELKRRLAEHLANSETYPEVKDPAVDLIYFAAEAWAVSTGWRPGPSDA